MELTVGLDVGTTSSKAVVVTEDGHIVSQGRARTPWDHSPLGIHVAACVLLESAKEALSSALTKAPQGRVAALGITSMGESGVLLDAKDRPLTPIIAWHDTRDNDELADLRNTVAEDDFAARTGLPLKGQWSLTKHRWLLDHDPAAGLAVRRLNIAEWIAFSLGGDAVTEQSLASRTGWLELGARDWWGAALDWSGLEASLLPELVTAGTNIGSVAAQAGLGRLTGAAITVAGHDHQVAVVGAGAESAGNVLDSSGTAAALVRTIDPGLDPGAILKLTRAGITVGWSAIADKWTLLGGTQAGLVLQTTLSMLGHSAQDIGRLDREAAGANAETLKLDADDASSLVLHGISAEVTPSLVWLAAVEAVTAQAKAVHATMSSVAGPHTSLVVTGGWSRSSTVVEAKERAFGTLEVSQVEEAGARGAALFGGMAAGLFRDITDFPRPDKVPSMVASQVSAARRATISTEKVPS
jgi:sugar (pentulose or hexulose) kinase